MDSICKIREKYVTINIGYYYVKRKLYNECCEEITLIKDCIVAGIVGD